MKKTTRRSILRTALVALSAILLLGTLVVASFAADVAEVRYQISGEEWQEATFVDAMAAADGKTATIELQKDVTLTTKVTLTGGTLTVQSKGDSIYTLTRASSLTNASMFTVNGGTDGATLIFKNITIDGYKNMNPGVDGGAVLLTGAKDKVVLNAGATIQNSGSTSKNGGAIYASAGTVEMNAGSAILNCKGNQGGGIYLGHQVNTSANVVFNMNGGLIKGCECNSGFGSGPAVYLRGYATFNMAGGLITENISNRDKGGDSHQANTFLDGAISGLVNVSHLNQITISGKAIVRNNRGYFWDGTALSAAPVLGADLVYTLNHHSEKNLTVASDFEGSFSFASNQHIASPKTADKIATAGEGWTEGTVIPGHIDANRNNMAVVKSDGCLGWISAAAEVDYNGKITRYASFADAYAAVGGNAPIRLLADASDIVLPVKVGDQVKVILNGHNFTISDTIVCEKPVVTTEKVGAYTYSEEVDSKTYELYTYAGKDAEVITYTVDYFTCVHVSEDEATAAAPKICENCGALMALPTDETVNTRYSFDDGVSWTYASFAKAMSDVSGETKIVEIFRDVTVAEAPTYTVTSKVTVRSLPAEFNAFGGEAPYSIKRGSNFAKSVFTVSGSAYLTFADITLDGQSISAAVDGAMFSMTSADATLVLDKGTTVQNSWSSKNGGMINATAGNIVMNVGVEITGCVALKGAVAQLNSGAIFTMNGGLIKGNATVVNANSHGSAIYMNGGNCVFRMSGGEITENTASRTNAGPATASTFVDGAISSIYDVQIYLSGDAKIYNNKGRWYENGESASVATVGADIVPWGNYKGRMLITIEEGFSGYVGISNSESASIASVPKSYADGTVIEGIFDCNNKYNVAKVTSSGKLSWAPAVAEVFTADGSSKIFGTLADALTAASEADKATVTLLQDVTLTAGTAITGGDVTIQSKDGETYTVYRGSAFTASCFTLSGGAKVTFKNITLDGQRDKYDTGSVHGAMICLGTIAETVTEGGKTIGKSNDLLILESGTTIRNCHGNKGGAICARVGTVEMRAGSRIENCKAGKGAGIFLGNREAPYSSATLNMSGGVITGCRVEGGSSSGSAICLDGFSYMNMSGGLVTDNYSGRTQLLNSGTYGTNAALDGAVVILGSGTAKNYVTFSGTAIVRGNYGYRYNGTELVRTYVLGADIVFSPMDNYPDILTVKEDFAGSISYCCPLWGTEDASMSQAVATVVGYDYGVVIPGFVDGNTPRVAQVMSDEYKNGWQTAVAEVDYNGIVTRYTSLEAAYAAVGDKAPIKLLKDVSGAELLKARGESVKLILNKHAFSFADHIVCGEPTVATEKVGAFTYESYTAEGVDAEVTIYTATQIICVHSSENAATEDTPEICDKCGRITAFPTNVAVDTRYSTDGGESWRYASFVDAMRDVEEQNNAIVEIFRDVTVAVIPTYKVATKITVRSLPIVLNEVEDKEIYTVERGSAFEAPIFTVDGGELTLESITIEGNGDTYQLTANGAVVQLTATTDKVILKNGTTIQNSYTTGHGGAIYSARGQIEMYDGAKILGCTATKGGAIYLGVGENTNVTERVAIFTMHGGLIKDCSAVSSGGFACGGGINLEGKATFIMKSGLITGCSSNRFGNQAKHADGEFVDGAVTIVRGGSVTVELSGDATIRGNKGYRVSKVGETVSRAWDTGADIVFTVSNVSSKSLIVKGDFCGSVGVSFSGASSANRDTDIAVGTEWKADAYIHGLFDSHLNRVAQVSSTGVIEWAAAEAEMDIDGKITRYATLDEAYTLFGSETPIKLISNATITFPNIGDTAKIIENGYSLTVKSEGSYEKSEGEQITIGAFTYKEYEFEGETVTVVTYTTFEGGSISSVALSAGTDLSLYFYSNMGSKFADSILRVTRAGNTVELSATYVDALGLYCYTYSDIAPQCAGDPISVELVNGDAILFTFEGYSILSYCQQVLAMDAESLGFEKEKCEELKTLLRDLLTYCASAQTYLGYNTDALVNKGIKGSSFALPAYTPKKAIAHNTVEGVTFTEANVNFDNINRLFFEFTTTDPSNTRIELGNKTLTEFTPVEGKANTYRVYTDGLYATQFDVVFTAKLYFGDTLVQTVKYSVGAYAHSLVTAEAGEYTEAAINLAKATYNYGVAARVWTDTYKALTNTAAALSGANTLGGATFNNGALVMDQPASGIEFAFRGKGDVVLNLTAEEAARIEVMVDGQVLPHFLVSAGTADYTVKTGLADGKHTVRIVQENGAVTLNSANVKGYFTAPEAQTKDLFIEFVGSDALLGRNIFLNYSEVEDDATDAYAVLAARELGAKYLISATDKKFAATANTPDLVVIEYQNGADYAKLLSDIRTAYGADVKILFVGVMDTIASMDEDFCNLTKDVSGVEGYPSAGGAAIQGAELAKYIRENSGFFTEEEIAKAKKDIIVEVDAADKTSGYNTFHVYIRTSDPLGNYYIRYNFVHQYDLVRNNFAGSKCTNISNFRIIGADLVEVTGFNGTKATYQTKATVLGDGEISAALKTMSDKSGIGADPPKEPSYGSANDFTGGFHGDEWILGVDGTNGHLDYENWIPAIALLADGKEIDIVGAEAQLILCNTLTFDQATTMYEWGTSLENEESDLAKRGTPLVIHTQHFTITRESGIHNRQGFEWLKNINIDTSSNYLLMFTMIRYKDGINVCTDTEVFNVNGVSNGSFTHYGPDKLSGMLHNATNRFARYDGDLGVFSYARYDLCHVGEFETNDATLVDIWVSPREDDNKLYVRFKSRTNNDKVVAGEYWTLDVAYGIDYVNPNN